MKKLLLAVAWLIAFPAFASAIDFSATGTTLTVTYTEPSTNTDGTALDDLSHTNVYSQVGTGAEVKGPNVPASRLTGGASVVTNVTVPIAVGQRATVTIRATATDTSGNESAKSLAVTKTVDRLSPMQPQ